MPLPSDARWAHAVSALLSRPAKPYQTQVAARLSEPNLAATGYAHPTAVLIMPRQTGKTTGLFTLAVARMMNHRNYWAAYTAQTGHTVTERFTDPGAWLDQIESSPLRARHRTRRSQGTERLTNVRTQSFIKAFPPRPGKLRSNALDLVVLDECQEHSWEVGRALDTDVGPVFSTRPRRQLVYAGTAAGPSWWRSKYEQAKAGQHLLVEIGTWPDDADPTDPAVWWAHHPGLQTGLTDEAFLRSQLDMLGPQSFAREYGNRWDDDATGDAPIPLTAWQACTPTTPGRPVSIAYDVTPDRTRCAVVGVTDTGSIRLLHHGPADTLPQALRDLGTDDLTVHAPPDQSGTSLDLRRDDTAARWLTLTEYRQACQQFHDAVVAGTVHHDHQAPFTEAFGWAGRSWTGDTWVLSARASGGDVTPAKAAVCAWWAAQHADAIVM